MISPPSAKSAQHVMALAIPSVPLHPIYCTCRKIDGVDDFPVVEVLAPKTTTTTKTTTTANNHNTHHNNNDNHNSKRAHFTHFTDATAVAVIPPNLLRDDECGEQPSLTLQTGNTPRTIIGGSTQRTKHFVCDKLHNNQPTNTSTNLLYAHSTPLSSSSFSSSSPSSVSPCFSHRAYSLSSTSSVSAPPDRHRPPSSLPITVCSLSSTTSPSSTQQHPLLFILVETVVRRLLKGLSSTFTRTLSVFFLLVLVLAFSDLHAVVTPAVEESHHSLILPRQSSVMITRRRMFSSFFAAAQSVRVAIVHSQELNLDGLSAFDVMGDDVVATFRNDGTSSYAARTTIVEDAGMGSYGPADHITALLFLADSPTTTPPPNRGPWTITVNNILFTNPNGRLEFKGKFPDNSRITIKNLFHTYGDAAGIVPNTRLNGLKAFVMFNAAEFVVNTIVTIQDSTLVRWRVCSPTVQNAFIYVNHSLRVSGGSVVEIKSVKFSVFDTQNQSVSDCFANKTARIHYNAIRFDANVSIFDRGQININNNEFYQTADQVDFTAFVFFFRLNMSSNAVFTAQQNSMSVAAHSPTLKLSVYKERGGNVVGVLYPHSTLVLVGATAAERFGPSANGFLTLTQSSFFDVSDNFMADASCLTQSHAWNSVEGVGRSSRLNYFVAINPFNFTFSSNARLRFDGNRGDAKCSAYGALVRAVNRTVGNVSVSFSNNNATGFLPTFDMGSAYFIRTMFPDLATAFRGGFTSPMVNVSVTIAHNTMTWGRPCVLYRQLDHSIYHEDAQYPIIRSNFVIFNNTANFVYEPLLYSFNESFAPSLLLEFGQIHDSTVMVEHNKITFPPLSLGRVISEVVTPYEAAFGISVSSASDTAFIIRANILDVESSLGFAAINRGSHQLGIAFSMRGGGTSLSQSTVVISDNNINGPDTGIELYAEHTKMSESDIHLNNNSVFIGGPFTSCYVLCVPYNTCAQRLTICEPPDNYGGIAMGGVTVGMMGSGTYGGEATDGSRSGSFEMNDNKVLVDFNRVDPTMAIDSGYETIIREFGGVTIRLEESLALYGTSIVQRRNAIRIVGDPSGRGQSSYDPSINNVITPNFVDFYGVGVFRTAEAAPQAKSFKTSSSTTQTAMGSSVAEESTTRNHSSATAARRRAHQRSSSSSSAQRTFASSSSSSPLSYTRTSSTLTGEDWIVTADDYGLFASGGDAGSYFEQLFVIVSENAIDANFSSFDHTYNSRRHSIVAFPMDFNIALLAYGSNVSVVNNKALIQLNNTDKYSPSDSDFSINIVTVLLAGKMLLHDLSSVNVSGNIFVGWSDSKFVTFTGVQLWRPQSHYCHGNRDTYNQGDFSGSFYSRLEQSHWSGGPFNNNEWGVCDVFDDYIPRRQTFKRQQSDDEEEEENEEQPSMPSHHAMDGRYSLNQHVRRGGIRSDTGPSSSAPSAPAKPSTARRISPADVGASNDDGDVDPSKGAHTNIPHAANLQPLLTSDSYSSRASSLFAWWVDMNSFIAIDNNQFTHHVKTSADHGGSSRCQERMLYLGTDFFSLYVNKNSFVSISGNTFAKWDSVSKKWTHNDLTTASYLGISIESAQVLSITNQSSFTVERNTHLVQHQSTEDYTFYGGLYNSMPWAAKRESARQTFHEASAAVAGGDLEERRIIDDEGKDDQQQRYFESLGSGAPESLFPSCGVTLQATSLNFTIIVSESESKIRIANNRFDVTSDSEVIANAKGFVLSSPCSQVVFEYALDYTHLFVKGFTLIRYNSTLAVDGNQFSFVARTNPNGLKHNLPENSAPFTVIRYPHMMASVGAAFLAPWSAAMVFVDSILSVNQNHISVVIPTNSSLHPVGAGILSNSQLVSTRSTASVSDNNVKLHFANLTKNFDVNDYTVNRDYEANTVTGVFLCSLPTNQLPVYFNLSTVSVDRNVISIESETRAYGIQSMTCDVFSRDSNVDVPEKSYNYHENCDDDVEAICSNFHGFEKKPWGYDYCPDTDLGCNVNAYLCNYEFHDCPPRTCDFYYYGMAYNRFFCCDDSRAYEISDGSNAHLTCDPSYYYYNDGYHGCYNENNYPTDCIDRCNYENQECTFYYALVDGYGQYFECDNDNCAVTPSYYYCNGDFQRCRGGPKPPSACKYYYYSPESGVSEFGESYFCCQNNVMTVDGDDHSCIPQYYYDNEFSAFTPCDHYALSRCIPSCDGVDTPCRYFLNDDTNTYEDCNDPNQCSTGYADHYLCFNSFERCNPDVVSRGLKVQENQHGHNHQQHLMKRITAQEEENVANEEEEEEDREAYVYNHRHPPATPAVHNAPPRHRDAAVLRSGASPLDSPSERNHRNDPSPIHLSAKRTMLHQQQQSPELPTVFFSYPSYANPASPNPAFNPLMNMLPQAYRSYSVNGYVSDALPFVSATHTQMDGESTFSVSGNSIRVLGVGMFVVGVDVHSGWTPQSYYLDPEIPSVVRYSKDFVAAAADDDDDDNHQEHSHPNNSPPPSTKHRIPSRQTPNNASDASPPVPHSSVHNNNNHRAFSPHSTHFTDRYEDGALALHGASRLVIEHNTIFIAVEGRENGYYDRSAEENYSPPPEALKRSFSEQQQDGGGEPLLGEVKSGEGSTTSDNRGIGRGDGPSRAAETGRRQRLSQHDLRRRRLSSSASSSSNSNQRAFSAQDGYSWSTFAAISIPHTRAVVNGSSLSVSSNTILATTVFGLQYPEACYYGIQHDIEATPDRPHIQYGSSDYWWAAYVSGIMYSGRQVFVEGSALFSVSSNTITIDTSLPTAIYFEVGMIFAHSDGRFLMNENVMRMTRTAYDIYGVYASIHTITAKGENSAVEFNENQLTISTCGEVVYFLGYNLDFDGAVIDERAKLTVNSNALHWTHAQSAIITQDDISGNGEEVVEKIVMRRFGGAADGPGAPGSDTGGSNVGDATVPPPGHDVRPDKVPTPPFPYDHIVAFSVGYQDSKNPRIDRVVCHEVFADDAFPLFGWKSGMVINNGASVSMDGNSVVITPKNTSTRPEDEGNVPFNSISLFSFGTGESIYLLSDESVQLPVGEPTGSGWSDTSIPIVPAPVWVRFQQSAESAPLSTFSISNNRANVRIAPCHILRLTATSTNLYVNGMAKFSGNTVTYQEQGVAGQAIGGNLGHYYSVGIVLFYLTVKADPSASADPANSQVLVDDNQFDIPMAGGMFAGIYVGACIECDTARVSVSRNRINFVGSRKSDNNQNVINRTVDENDTQMSEYGGIYVLLGFNDQFVYPANPIEVLKNKAFSEQGGGGVGVGGANEKMMKAQVTPLETISRITFTGPYWLAVRENTVSASTSRIPLADTISGVHILVSGVAAMECYIEADVNIDASRNTVQLPYRRHFTNDDESTTAGVIVAREAISDAHITLNFDASNIDIVDGIGIWLQESYLTHHYVSAAVTLNSATISVLCLGRSAYAVGCFGAFFGSTEMSSVTYESITIDGSDIDVRVAGLQSATRFISALFVGATSPFARLVYVNNLNFNVKNSRLLLAGVAGAGTSRRFEEVPVVVAVNVIRLFFNQANNLTVNLNSNTIRFEFLEGNPQLFEINPAFIGIGALADEEEYPSNITTGTINMVQNLFSNPQIVGTVVPPIVPHSASSSNFVDSPAIPIGSVTLNPDASYVPSTADQFNLTFLSILNEGESHYSSFAECNRINGVDYAIEDQYNDTQGVFRVFRWDEIIPCEVTTTTTTMPETTTSATAEPTTTTTVPATTTAEPTTTTTTTTTVHATSTTDESTNTASPPTTTTATTEAPATTTVPATTVTTASTTVPPSTSTPSSPPTVENTTVTAPPTNATTTTSLPPAATTTTTTTSTNATTTAEVPTNTITTFANTTTTIPPTTITTVTNATTTTTTVPPTTATSTSPVLCPSAALKAAMTAAPWFAEVTVTDRVIKSGGLVNVSLSSNASHVMIAATALMKERGIGYGGGVPMVSVNGSSATNFVGSSVSSDVSSSSTSGVGISILDADLAALLSEYYGQASVECSPLIHRSLRSIGGNSMGFAHNTPSNVTFSPAAVRIGDANNNTVATSSSSSLHLSAWGLLQVAPISDYEIYEPESLDIYVPIEVIAGTLCSGGGGGSSSSFVKIGSIRVVPADEDPFGGAPDAATGVSTGSTVVAVIAGAAGMAAEQQGLSAIAMMTCADPHTQGAFGSYRSLSPFAVENSYIGVVAGNFLFLLIVFVLQGLVLLAMRLWKKVRRWEELSALARFPAILLNCSFSIHTGTAYAASQLVSLPDRTDADRAVGYLALIFTLLYPVGLIGFAYKFVGRAYQSYEISEFLLARKNWPSWVTYLLPQGAIYAVETRKTFGPLISAYRQPEHYWPSYPTWTPLIFAVGGLFHPDTIPKCQALFACMAIAFILCCAVILWRKPRRADGANWLDAAAKGLSAAVLFCMMVAIEPGPDGVNAATAAYAFGFIQTAVTIIRMLYALVLTYFDRQLQQLPLTQEWVHYTSDGAKTAKKFDTDYGGELGDEAARRDMDDAGMMIELESNKSNSRSNSDDDDDDDIISGSNTKKKSSSSASGKKGSSDQTNKNSNGGGKSKPLLPLKGADLEEAASVMVMDGAASAKYGGGGRASSFGVGVGSSSGEGSSSGPDIMSSSDDAHRRKTSAGASKPKNSSAAAVVRQPKSTAAVNIGDDDDSILGGSFSSLEGSDNGRTPPPRPSSSHAKNNNNSMSSRMSSDNLSLSDDDVL